jgi:dynein heavy chain, axonemal
MRAVKSVLVMAGTLKRSNPDLSEDVVLIRAMRDSNIPKFLAQDLPLFSALIQDLFPGIKIPEANYGDLSKQVSKSLLDLSLQEVSAFSMKVIQLFDTFNVRFGVMIVGPTGGGKSTCYRVLAHAMTALRAANSVDMRY